MAKASFTPEIADGAFLAACVKYDGNVTAMSKHYNVSIDTMYEFFKRTPEAKKILDTVRGLNTEVILDLAEHVIKFNLMNFKNDRKLAQRAAEKVIDKKGHSRGWHDIVSSTPPGDGQINDILTGIKDAKDKIDAAEQEADQEL